MLSAGRLDGGRVTARRGLGAGLRRRLRGRLLGGRLLRLRGRRLVGRLLRRVGLLWLNRRKVAGHALNERRRARHRLLRIRLRRLRVGLLKARLLNRWRLEGRLLRRGGRRRREVGDQRRFLLRRLLVGRCGRLFVLLEGRREDLLLVGQRERILEGRL
jgi:hypothetical protein